MTANLVRKKSLTATGKCGSEKSGGISSKQGYLACAKRPTVGRWVLAFRLKEGWSLESGFGR